MNRVKSFIFSKSVMHYTLLLLVLAICPIFLQAQSGNIGSANSPAINGLGRPLGGINVTVCNHPATGGYPCSNPATVYTDSTLMTVCTSTCSNPSTTDPVGNWGFWVTPGLNYDVEFYGLGITSKTITIPAPCSLGLCNPSSINNIIFVDGVKYPTIASAISALSPCTVNYYNGGSNTSQTWTHCGDVVFSGVQTVSSEIDITSPYVTLRGLGPQATINWTGTSGCAINWTASPFISEWVQGPEIDNVRIDGVNGSAGTCGLETHNLSGFHAHNLQIVNFTGPNSVCWNSLTDSSWNEKYDVELLTDNCTTHIRMLRGTTGTGSTFGFAEYYFKMSIFPGQTGFLLDGGTQGSALLAESIFHLTANQRSNPANDTVIKLQNGAAMSNNLYDIHIEAPGAIGTGHEINVDGTSSLLGLGTFDQSFSSSNVISGPFALGYFTQVVNSPAFALLNFWESNVSPTISSGFGTSPSIVQENGTAAFEVNVGTGGSATSGVIGLPTAANGWSCTAVDMNTNIVTRETAFTTTTVTLTAASAWTASDKLLVNCGAF